MNEDIIIAGASADEDDVQEEQKVIRSLSPPREKDEIADEDHPMGAVAPLGGEDRPMLEEDCLEQLPAEIQALIEGTLDSRNFEKNDLKPIEEGNIENEV